MQEKVASLVRYLRGLAVRRPVAPPRTLLQPRDPRTSACGWCRPSRGPTTRTRSPRGSCPRTIPSPPRRPTCGTSRCSSRSGRGREACTSSAWCRCTARPRARCPKGEAEEGRAASGRAGRAARDTGTGGGRAAGGERGAGGRAAGGERGELAQKRMGQKRLPFCAAKKSRWKRVVAPSRVATRRRRYLHTSSPRRSYPTRTYSSSDTLYPQ